MRYCRRHCCLRAVHEAVAGVWLGKVPGRVCDFPSRRWENGKVQRTRLVHIDPQYGHGQKLARLKKKGVVLRVTPRNTFRDFGVVVVPTAIGTGICPEPAVIVGLGFTQTDRILPRWSKEVSFKRYRVGRCIRFGTLAGERVPTVLAGVEVDVTWKNSFNIDARGVVVESRRIRLRALSEIGWVVKPKVLHTGGRPNY